jgi:Protein of unknown function (DUF3810)
MTTKRGQIWLITGWVVVISLVLVVRILTYNKTWVEEYYSTGVYPSIGMFFRWIFGWIPFSIGDLLYVLAGIWILYKIFRLIKIIRRRAISRKGFMLGTVKYAGIAIILYLMFNIFWGLNYNRKGIAHQLELEIKQYSPEKLKEINEVLLEKTNKYKQLAINKPALTNNQVFAEAVQSYRILKQKHSFLNYQTPSIKSSLFGTTGNYMGNMGYYNPFTGEAQVNTTVPRFALPFVTCHEIAHQIGYAKENEANFVGYLAAKESADSFFLYSLYFDLFLYANSELHWSDSAAARKNYERLIPEVKKDLKELREFSKKYRNPFTLVFDAFYDRFLRLNEQPDGQRTYNKVVLWLMAYYEKHGDI